MIRALVLAAVTVLRGALQNVPPELNLEELTLPQDRRPAECVLASNPGGLPVPSNPWSGTDKAAIASIRERIDGPLLLPDGPPLTARQVSRYRLHLADDVEEGYVAVYAQADAALISVYAVRLAADARRRDPPRNNPRAAENATLLRVEVGRTIVALHGGGGACFQAVAAHLKSFAR